MGGIKMNKIVFKKKQMTSLLRNKCLCIKYTNNKKNDIAVPSLLQTKPIFII